MESNIARPAVNRLSPRQRSQITNGSRLLDGVDGRRSSARRFRDLIADLARDEFGGSEGLSIAELGLLRQAAALTLQAEQLQAAVVRGETVNADELVRVSSESRRVLAAMRQSKRAVQRKPAVETLSEYLAANYPAGKDAADEETPTSKPAEGAEGHSSSDEASR
ncbi:MAG: hypothetical protein ACLPX7_18480 [Xanthobacteraceae bacterium]